MTPVRYVQKVASAKGHNAAITHRDQWATAENSPIQGRSLTSLLLFFSVGCSRLGFRWGKNGCLSCSSFFPPVNDFLFSSTAIITVGFFFSILASGLESARRLHCVPDSRHHSRQITFKSAEMRRK